MTYYDATELRQAADGITASGARLELSRASKSAIANFDIFLSHCLRDAILIIGLKRMLESEGLRVYVDWIDDVELDRTDVTPATAAQLRQRMESCRSLVYATSQNASSSRWMPWELGFFDGTHGAESVAICPISTGTGRYVGEEYLGLYKTLEKVRDGGVLRPFVVRPSRVQAERLQSFAARRGVFVGLS